MLIHLVIHDWEHNLLLDWIDSNRNSERPSVPDSQVLLQAISLLPT